MTNFKYVVTTHLNGEEVTYSTNNLRNVIAYFEDDLADGSHVDVMDGFTGEVLAIANSPDTDNYIAEEMCLTLIDFLLGENLDFVE